MLHHGWVDAWRRAVWRAAWRAFGEADAGHAHWRAASEPSESQPILQFCRVRSGRICATWHGTLRATAVHQARAFVAAPSQSRLAAMGDAIEIDEDLQSRQMAVYGRESMQMLRTCNVRALPR